MEDDIKKVEKKEGSVVSIASSLGNAGIEIGKKLGTVVTEFFVGKQPTKEEKELNVIRKERKLKLKLIQEDAQYQKDLEKAEMGEYVPPPLPESKKIKKSGGSMFANLGKNNPLEGFGLGNSSKALDFGIKGIGSGISSKTPDFGLGGFAGSVNPMESGKIKRRR